MVFENMSGISHLDQKAAAGEAFSRAEAEDVLACPDLVQVGVLGESMRRAIHGARVTFLRVCVAAGGTAAVDRGEAGELRLVGKPSSTDEARRWVHEGQRLAA